MLAQLLELPFDEVSNCLGPKVLLPWAYKLVTLLFGRWLPSKSIGLKVLLSSALIGLSTGGQQTSWKLENRMTVRPFFG